MWRNKLYSYIHHPDFIDNQGELRKMLWNNIVSVCGKLSKCKQWSHNILSFGIHSDTICGPQLLLNLFSRGFRLVGSLREKKCDLGQRSILKSYLYVFLHANKALFESIETRGIEHLFLDASCVWAPWHEQEFLLASLFRCALALVFIFKVVKAIAAVLRTTSHNIAQKLIIGRIATTWKWRVNQGSKGRFAVLKTHQLSPQQ